MDRSKQSLAIKKSRNIDLIARERKSSKIKMESNVCEEMHDVVIVGGGLCGLATALALHRYAFHFVSLPVLLLSRDK